MANVTEIPADIPAEQHKAFTSQPNVMMMGPPGAGKTFALGTLAKHRKLIYIYTDPGGDESLIDGVLYHGANLDNVHWKYIPPAAAGWGSLEDLAKKINMMGYESLTKISAGISKSTHNQMLELITTCSNFISDKTGEEFGPIDELDADEYAVVFDSITGLNKLAREQTVGSKPTLHQGEWGIAMSLEENFVRKFVADTKCMAVMIAHMDRVMDEVIGRPMFNAAFLGNKLAPQIPHLFSDVIHSYVEGAEFKWATADDRMALKSRNLPIKAGLKPDFGPIIEKFEARRTALLNKGIV